MKTFKSANSGFRGSTTNAAVVVTEGKINAESAFDAAVSQGL